MKNPLLLSFTCLMLCYSLFTGCKKDDTSPPVVTLIGASVDTISLQGTYSELGATADDFHDGALTPVAEGSVDVNLTGTYIITYSVKDAAGNSGSNTRAITVVNDADYLSGTYSCELADTPPYVFLQSIQASTTINNRIVYGKFSDYAGNTSIFADIDGSNLIIPSQTALQVGPSGNKADRVFEGTGTITDTGFSISYTETENSTTIAVAETHTKK